MAPLLCRLPSRTNIGHSLRSQQPYASPAWRGGPPENPSPRTLGQTE
uniref:Uncharacterized protein n=1 Tax=Anguilla anguilla TaxID=7936 RepID=A0A0E9WIP7_ANGAN